MACAAGLAVLEVIAQEGLIERSRRLGDEALERLRALTRDLPGVTDVRGVGLLLGVELDSADRAEAVLYRCLSAGLSFKVGQGRVLVLAPPLNIEAGDLWWALDVVCAALRDEARG